MKKLTYLILAVGVIFIASCQTAPEKAAGTYNGNFIVAGGSPQSGNTEVAAASPDKVNLVMTYTAGPTGNLTSVTAVANGDVVTLSYSSTALVESNIISLNGTKNGNSLNYTLVVYYSSGNIEVTFSGNK